MISRERIDFLPPRRRGAIIHLALILLVSLAAALATWLATNEPIGPDFALYILAAGIAFAPLPVLAYRFYSLQRSAYRLDRDQLVIQWGLRVEKIPISDIEWVRPSTDLPSPLPLPVLRLPGSVLGHRQAVDLGRVEFIAAEVGTLLLLATRKQVLAISPADPAGFVQHLQNAMEMGSLTPVASESLYPSFVVGEAWKDPWARFLWLAGLFLNIGLLAWVSLMSRNLPSVPLGFLPTGEPGEPVPGVGLILLPVLSSFLGAAGWIFGLAIYRRQAYRSLSLVTWAGSVVTAILFLIAVLILISVP